LEWTNLANQPEHASTKADLARWLPQENAPAQGEGSKASRKAEKKAKSKKTR
jgi:hypothetical protein